MRALRFANPLCCALDRAGREESFALARRIAREVGALKLGLEFFTANGPAAVEEMAGLGVPIFLDLKFHDIPHTVAGAVAAACRLPVTLLTLHAAGGRAMLEAAVRARDAATGSRPRLLAVTVLTSLDDSDLRLLGTDRTVGEQVLALAEMALACGIDGLVCSPHELSELRRRFGDEPLLVVPGIRPRAAGDDQKRILDPRTALELGADLLVIGRPIVAAADPAAAARAIRASLEGAILR
ncbi:Orotidine 5'-phosphate decarboxylase [bacterium HR40]|nr:Orotidine 5'-phosphate decarboxylase [bacterium HR40]